MDSRILWRAALTQLAAVAALSLALGLALLHDFFPLVRATPAHRGRR